MWSKALVIFALIATLSALFYSLVQLYFLINLNKFMSYELGPLLYVFEYQPLNTTINITFDADKIRNILRTGIFLDLSIIG